MKINHIFLSVNAGDFAKLSEWWTKLIGRRWDREPMPSCREWSLSGDVLFQVLDNPTVKRGTTVTLHVPDIDDHIARLSREGIVVPDPVKVEGFETLRYSEFVDPEGNTVGLLDGN